MESLVTQQRDVRMLREKIVDGGRAGLLHAGDYEIDALDPASLENARRSLPARPLGSTTGRRTVRLPE
jgi:hypothetical protein